MNTPLNSYKDLVVWQKAIATVTEIYRLTEKFPRQETYGLASQMQRAAISIPSNIAEDRNRGTRRDFLQFLRIALGSATELKTQLIIARNLEYCDATEKQKIEERVSEVCRMLHGMIRKLALPES